MREKLLKRVNEVKKGAINFDTMEQLYKWSRLSGWTQMLLLVHTCKPGRMEKRWTCW